MLAAQIQNLPPDPPPTPVAAEAPRPPRKKTGGGDWPQSNLYDLAENDYQHDYYDPQVADENVQVELADISVWAQLLANMLGDNLTVEVHALDTQAVVVDSMLVGAGDDIGPQAAAATSDLDIRIDVLAVVDDDPDDQ